MVSNAIVVVVVVVELDTTGTSGASGAAAVIDGSAGTVVATCGRTMTPLVVTGDAVVVDVVVATRCVVDGAVTVGIDGRTITPPVVGVVEGRIGAVTVVDGRSVTGLVVVVMRWIPAGSRSTSDVVVEVVVVVARTVVVD